MANCSCMRSFCDDNFSMAKAMRVLSFAIFSCSLAAISFKSSTSPSKLSCFFLAFAMTDLSWFRMLSMLGCSTSMDSRAVSSSSLSILMVVALVLCKSSYSARTFASVSVVCCKVDSVADSSAAVEVYCSVISSNSFCKFFFFVISSALNFSHCSRLNVVSFNSVLRSWIVAASTLLCSIKPLRRPSKVSFFSFMLAIVS
mmetsp:Transcript_14198/g.27603  ORF Transcript_14198/g.27603 Transcript_14198/m.27603 type:complete len:200 (-) Transcript_14198:1069-1668(-)